jgi:hypothetical protein
MNREHPHSFEGPDYDDGPHAETSRRNANYDRNLAAQRAELAEKDANSTPENLKPLRRVYEHQKKENHKAFLKFLSGQDPETRDLLAKQKIDRNSIEQMFLEWLEKQQN